MNDIKMKGKTFSCSECGYQNDQKYTVERHVTKKCEGAKIEIISIEIKCNYCKKEYTTRSSLKRHIKSCQKKTVEKQAKEIEELRRQLEEAKSQPPQTVVNQYIQVNVNGYRQTSFEHITDRQYKRAISRMIYSVPQMIENVHFDPKVPENHNIYISNIKNKYAMVYDGEKWCSKPQDQVIDQLINDQEYAIEEWLGEGEKFPKEMKKFNEYLNKKEQSTKSDEIKQVIKEEVKLLLYNNRNKIKNKA
jgi:hypothetical protein